MPNLYFRNFDAENEQNLLHDLVIESIKIYGEEMQYIPRELKRYDRLYGEDAISEYNKAINIDIYIKSFDGFQGDGTFMSKFGLQIRDQAVFSIAQRTFLQEITPYTGLQRPNEGDLIYFPLNEKCFKIMYVKKQEFFYPLGTLPTWEVTVELFEYANEKLSTGIEAIDKLQTNFSLNILDYALRDEDGNVLIGEAGEILVTENYAPADINPLQDNEVLQSGTDNFPEGSDSFLSFDEINPLQDKNY
jgi:hypothetical protein